MNLNFAMALAAGAGVAIAMQAAANSRLGRTLGEPLWATYFSILGTFGCATLVMAVLRPEIPSLTTLRGTVWWNWSGGLLGGLVVLSGTFLVPWLGAARFIAFVVAGQLAASLVLDHYALMGLKEQTISAGKVIGAVMIVAGVVCIKYL